MLKYVEAFCSIADDTIKYPIKHLYWKVIAGIAIDKKLLPISTEISIKMFETGLNISLPGEVFARIM